LSAPTSSPSASHSISVDVGLAAHEPRSLAELALLDDPRRAEKRASEPVRAGRPPSIARRASSGSLVSSSIE